MVEFKAKITTDQVREALKKDTEKRKLPAEKSLVPSKQENPQKASVPREESSEEPKKESKKKQPKETKKKKEPAAFDFPVSARINDYGFIGLKKGLLEALDWHKGMGLKIDKNVDGSVTVRKA